MLKRALVFLMLLSFLFLTPRAFSQDPGNPDTVKVEQKQIVGPSQQVTVDVYVYNDEKLGAFVIPLTFYNPDNSDVYCDSIHWSPRFWNISATYYAGAPGYENYIDTTNYKVNIWAVYFGTPFDTGSGLICTIYFTTGPEWNSDYGIILDSTSIPPTNKLEFTDVSTGYGFIPQYLPGCLGSALEVKEPNGGEVWYVGEDYDITWKSIGFSGNVKLEYSTNSGVSWSTIISSTTDDGIHSWTIPDNPSPDCRVRVSDAVDGSPKDRSDADFSIPYFTIGATPDLRVVDVGGSTNYNVNLGYLYGFANPINLTVLGLPGGTSGNFSPNPVNPPTSSSVLSINTTGATPAGHYTLTIQGEGSQIRTTQVTLVVNVAPTAFGLASPDSASTVSTLTPTLFWNESTDPDPNDTIKYIAYYTLQSDFSQYDSIAGLTGTSVVLPALSDDTVYYWKVRAVDKWGKSTWSNYTWYFRVYNPGSPERFSLIYPPDLDTVWQFSDTLVWHSTTDPDPDDSVLYDLYIDTHSGFASPTIISNLSDTSYYFTGKDDSTYYWKVLAKDINTSGRWSEQTFRFYIYVPQSPDPFSLLSPADNDTVILHPILTWQKATDPDPQDQLTYTLYWSLDSLFNTSDSVITLDTSHTLPELLDDTMYYWKVKVKDRFDLVTWSTQAYWSFRSLNVAPSSFNQISPTHQSTVSVLTPTLRWHKPFDPDPLDLITYKIYYSLDITFAVYDSAVTTDTSVVLPSLYDDSTYYWKVKAEDSYGAESWSIDPHWSFYVYYPEPPLFFTLLSPPDETFLSESTCDFIWQSTTDPDPGDSIVYDLWYDTHSGFSHPDIISDLSDTSQNVTLLDDSTYYWKVLAKDINTSGRWSTDVFRVSLYIPQPPYAFSLLSPPDGDTLSSLAPTLIWQEAIDPDLGDVVTYDLYYDTTQEFTTPVIVTDLNDTSYTTPQLEAGAFYWWKVKAKDTNTEGTWSSQTFKFYVPSCIPGDINADTDINVTDVIYLINYLFKGGDPPEPILGCGDMQCDGKVDVTDVIYLINYLFKGGPPPGC